MNRWSSLSASSSSFPISYAFFLLLMMTMPANAQFPPDENLFQWKFSENFLGPQLPSCQSFGITVEPVNATNVTHGIPPFYMIAWEIGGTPRTTLLGLNESSLSWTVDHPVGSSLMLNVVDSNGNGGGIPPQAYTVQSGQSTECIVNHNSTDFTVSANLTGTVNTCQPYGLRIRGGVPPYNLSLAQFNSPVVTNVTIPSPQNAFTYINRATPNFLLLAAVSDITGRYAFGTPIIMPTGSDDVICTGLNSSPGNATLLDQEQEAVNNIAKAKRNRIVMLAGILTPVLVLISGAAAFFLYRSYTKQQRMKKELTPEPLALPEPKAIEEVGVGSSVGTGVILESASPLSGPTSSSLLNPFITDVERVFAAPNDMIDVPSSNFTSGRSGSSSTGQGFVNFPYSSIRRSEPPPSAIQAGPAKSSGTTTKSTSQHTPFQRSLSAQPRGNTLPMMPVRSASLGSPFVLSPEGEPDFVIQHQDGGRYVHELPPPYEHRPRQIPDVPQSPW